MCLTLCSGDQNFTKQTYSSWGSHRLSEDRQKIRGKQHEQPWQLTVALLPASQNRARFCCCFALFLKQRMATLKNELWLVQTITAIPIPFTPNFPDSLAAGSSQWPKEYEVVKMDSECALSITRMWYNALYIPNIFLIYGIYSYIYVHIYYICMCSLFHITVL